MEKLLRQDIETYLEIKRQRELLGDDPDAPFQGESFLAGIRRFVENVLAPRINNAALGCRESREAIVGWVSFWRQVQLLGLTDISIEINGVFYYSSWPLPEGLLPTLVEHCFREAYERCVATGDFPGIFVPLFELQRVLSFYEEQLDPAQVELMVGYARRCGIWRLNISTLHEAEPLRGCCSPRSEAYRTIKLEWKPNGTGLGGIFGATVEGAADVVNESLRFISGEPELTARGTPPRPIEPSVAKLDKLEFSYSEYGTPRPERLRFLLNLGLTETQAVYYHRGRTLGPPIRVQLDGPEVGLYLALSGAVEEAADAPYSIRVDGAWRFRSGPFTAHLVKNGRANLPGTNSFARIELMLTHTPQ